MDAPEIRLGFWARQFNREPTRAQTAYDFLAGIIMMFWLLSSLARCFLLGGPPEYEYPLTVDQLSAHDLLVASFFWFFVLQLISLAIWLGLRRRLGRMNSLIGGALLPGAVLFPPGGLLLFPFAILAVFHGIENSTFLPLLLFPLVSAFSYVRCCWRAIRLGRIRYGNEPATTLAALGSVISGGPPIVLLLLWLYR